MRILLLKSLLLCTNCPSFLPTLCGILCVFAVDLFLPWNPYCFCRGFVFVVDLFLPWTLFVFVVDTFVYIPSSFLFLSFLLSSLQFSPTKSEKRGSFFGKSPSFLGKSPSFFCFSRRCCEVIMLSNVPVKRKACLP